MTRHVRLSSIELLILVVISLFTGAAAYGAGGDSIWQTTDTQPGKQEAKAFAVDSAGNVIVTGYRNLGDAAGDDFHTVKFTAAGTVVWRADFNKSNGSDQAVAVAVDTNNDVIVVGNVWNGSDYDLQIIKYNGADGSLSWQHTYAGPAAGHDYATAVTVDAGNNIYVAGYSFNSSGNDDILILKYPAAGSTPIWTEIHDSPYHGHDRAVAIAAGTDGIVVTGNSWNGTDFDILTRKYDFDKNFIGQVRYSSPGAFQDNAVAVKIDPSGDAVITGFTTSAQGKDIYTAKYNMATGTTIWDHTYAGMYDDEPKALWIDGSGDLYITGFTFTLSGHDDIYTARYSGATGVPVWEKIFNSGSDATDIATGIVVDDAGDLFVTGFTVTAGNYDILTLKYRKNSGNLLWQKSFQGPQNKNERPVGVLLAPSRDLYVAGWTDSWTAGTGDIDYLLLKYDYGRLNGPTNLNAAVAAATAITLTWTDNADNEEQFIIERKLGEGGVFAPVTTVPNPLPANTTTYTDTGLAANNYYYYRVRASSAADGNSAYSNVAHALTRVVSYDSPVATFTYGGPDFKEDMARAIAVGSDDHPVVTGFTTLLESGTADTFTYDYNTIKLDRNDLSIKWSALYDSGDAANDKAVSVAVDAANDVLVTGTAYVWGGGVENSDDLFTLKYRASTHTNPALPPATVWAKGFGHLDHADQATMVASAANVTNDVALVGYGKMDSPTDNIYVIKYNGTTGDQAWPPVVYDSGYHDYPVAVSFDPSGNIVVTGYSYNAAENTDILTAKYDGATGTLLWSDLFAGAGNGDDRPLAMATDANGNVFVTGYSVTSGGNRDFYTIKYDGATVSAQRRIWEQAYNGPANGDDSGVAVKLDPIDNAVVVAGTSLTSATDTDFHLIRYNAADGSLLWERNFDRPGSYDYVKDLAIDSSGYIYLAGNTRSGPESESAFNATSNVLSLIYDYEGTFLGATTYDQAGTEDAATAITVNFQGEAFIAGYSRRATGDGDADYLVYKQKNNYLLTPAPLELAPQADYSRMNLSWRQNTPGTNFLLERTIGPSTPSSIWSTVTASASGTSYQDTGLAAGSYYCYRIDATLGSFNSRKIEKCAATTLAAPTLGTPVVDSPTQITLTWNNVGGNTGYRIERKTGSGGAWGVLATTSADQVTLADSGLAAGTTYYYRVSTGSASGYSLPSNESPSITKPAAPALNLPAGVTKAQMSLSWGAVTGAASYTLQAKPEGGSFAAVSGCTAITGTSCNATLLSSNTRYYFQVKATNTSGDSSWSNQVDAWTMLPDVTLQTVTMTSATVVSLAWTDVTGETSYKIQQSTCSFPEDVNGCNTNTPGGYYWSAWSDPVTGLPADTTSSTRTHGLTAGVNVAYRIIAANANTSSAPSNFVRAKTWFAKPATPTVSPDTITSLKISWTDVTGETNYGLERKQGVAGSWGDVNGATALTTGTVTYINTGLLQSTEYCYRVKAYSNETYAPAPSYSDEACRPTPLNAPVLQPPTGLSTTQIKLDWSNVSGNNGYEVQRALSNDFNYPQSGYWGFWTTITVPKLAANTTTFTDSSLTPGYSYKYRVRDTFGTSEYSNWSDELWATTVPPAPEITTTTANSATQLYLQWTNTYGETSFKLEWKPRVGSDCTGGAWNGPITTGQNAYYYSHSGLTPGTWYCYRVRASNASGDSAYGITAAQTTLLTPPTLNPLTGITASKIDLSWSNVTGNIGYDVQRSTDGTTFTNRGSTLQNVVTFSDTGLTAGTLYYYRLIAKNTLASGTGYSAPSSVLSTVTSPAAPTVTLTPVGPGQITVSWPVKPGATQYKLDQKEAGGSYAEIGTMTVSYGESYCGAPYPTTACQSLSPNLVIREGTGLKANTTYCYQVRAWNAPGGYSTPSAEQCTTTSNLATPTLTATPLNAAAVRLDWLYDPNSCGEVACTGDIDAVSLEVNLSGTWVPLTATAPTITTYIDRTGLNPKSRYLYRARARKEGSYSLYSPEVSVNTPSYSTSPGTCP